MRIILSLLLLCSIVFADITIASWNLLHLSAKTLQKKDSQFIAQYLRKYDLFVIEEVMDKKALNALTTKKVLYSRRTGRGRYKEYIAFVVSGNLLKERLRVFNYYDSHDTFERDPAMLAVGDRFGVVGVHLLYGKRKHGNVELTKREIRGLANMRKYFSKKSGIPENRIVVAGDFNLPASTIQNIVSHEQKVLIEEGTTVSTSKKRIAAHDYDHFVIPHDMRIKKAFVDYEVLGDDRSVKHRTWFRKKVSDHYPIIGVFPSLIKN